MSHQCHATGCLRYCPPQHLMCAPHWRMVPWALQKAVWSTYQAGQERREVAPSQEWHDAADAAIHAVWQRENPDHGQRQVRSVPDWLSLKQSKAASSQARLS